MMNYEQDFEMGRFLRAQNAAFNNPDFKSFPTFIDTGITPLELEQNAATEPVPFNNRFERYKAAAFNAEMLLPHEEKESMLNIEIEINGNEVMEMVEEVSLFRVDSSPRYNKQKSFAMPFNTDVRKKKKRLNRLIGKLAKERRHAEATRIKQRRRQSHPLLNSSKYVDHRYVEDDGNTMEFQTDSRCCSNMLL